jgi:acyl-CoA thioester hydrolase
VNWDKSTPFVVSIRVDSSDIDELGHVNNAAYVRWLERCAWRHSESLGLGVAEYKTLDRAMVVLRHEIDYLAAAYLHDEVMVATWIVASDNKLRLTRHFQIMRANDQATLLRARSNFVCIELSSGKARRMPEIFVETYGKAITIS